MIHALRTDRRGVAAVEFALIAPFLFGLLFLVIESGRMVWTQQVLQETAFAAARCLGLRSAGCATEGLMPGWAAARARESGLVIQTTTVTATAAATSAQCNGRGGMSRISITSPYSKAVGSILPAARNTLIARACFPTA